VKSLLSLLGLSEMADVVCSLDVLSNTRKHNAAVPEHLPVKSTLFHLLHTCCEIRHVPRKVNYTCTCFNWPSFLLKLLQVVPGPHENRTSGLIGAGFYRSNAPPVTQSTVLKALKRIQSNDTNLGKMSITAFMQLAIYCQCL